jgi:hypothetical protein
VDEGARTTSPTAGPDAAATEVDRLEELGEEIARLAAHLHAGRARFLELVAAFDRRRGWEPSGHRSCARWLSFRTGYDLRTARGYVRAARALEELPATREAMARGRLAFSQVRALTRVATPETETDLLALAEGCTTATLERRVRAWKRGSRQDEAARERALHRARRLACYPDEDGLYVLRARLEPEVGAVLMRAIEAAADALYREGPDEPDPTRGSREPPSPRQAHREAARRLACDVAAVHVNRHADGSVLDVGRRTRTVPPALRRALEVRDRGCRFPGCGLRFTDAHHLVHWADGGATSLENTLLLCRRHHRLVHEEG